MKIGRLIAVALMAGLIPACGSSSSSPSEGDALTLRALGGSAFSSDATGAGNVGGNVSMTSAGALDLSALGPRSAPFLPTPPTTGTELTNALISAGAPIAGNVLVSSTLQIAAGVNPAVITTNSGDVVIFGSLIGERSAGTTTNGITISAPAGTIYVLGSIVTRGSAGSPDNPNGGPVTLSALEIVLTGQIDAGGESLAGASGGTGGAISLSSTADILIEGGIVQSLGGAGMILGAAGGNGGNGGAITLQAGGNLVEYGTLAADGGAANSNASTPAGGTGGNITLQGNGSAEVAGPITCTGGAAQGLTTGATGGHGGVFTAGSAAPYRIFGLIDTSGGNATAQAGSPSGGTAGNIDIGTGTPVASLVLGRGTYLTNGGSGPASGAGAGNFTLTSKDGDIPVTSVFSARGGGGMLPGMNTGGAGGSVSITTDADPAGNTSNHSLLMLSGSIDTRGGPAGGQAGPVTLQCGGDLFFAGTILAQGQDFTSAAPSSAGSGGTVSLLVNAANTVPSGTLQVQGEIHTEGGRFTAQNGKGGPINLKIVKAGSTGVVLVNATLSSSAVSGASASAGNVTIQAITGNITLNGAILAHAANTTSPDTPGNVSITTAGSITVSALIDVACDDANPANPSIPGGNGGAVAITSSGAAGSISLSGTVNANAGGASQGALNPAGGNGGTLLLSTVDQPILVSATITARGGFGLGNGPGGTGGQVVMVSDSDANGIGGAITLTGLIDVSGGSGIVGGQTRNNGGLPPADSSGTNLAVILDAVGGRTSSPDTGGEGVVQNLGRIIAVGGSAAARGGDIWFDGKNALGAELGPADGGSLNLSGPAGSGVFFPN